MTKRFLCMLFAMALPLMGATRNVVPNADGEGTIGATNLRWAAGHFVDVFVQNGVNVTNLAISSGSVTINVDMASVSNWGDNYTWYTNHSTNLFYRNSNNLISASNTFQSTQHFANISINSTNILDYVRDMFNKTNWGSVAMDGSLNANGYDISSLDELLAYGNSSLIHLADSHISDQDGVTSVTWHTRGLHDSAGVVSLNYQNRHLTNGAWLAFTDATSGKEVVGWSVLAGTKVHSATNSDVSADSSNLLGVVKADIVTNLQPSVTFGDANLTGTVSVLPASETNSPVTLQQLRESLAGSLVLYGDANQITDSTFTNAVTNGCYALVTSSHIGPSAEVTNTFSIGEFSPLWIYTNRTYTAIAGGAVEVEIMCYESGAGSMYIKPEFYRYFPVTTNLVEWGEGAVSNLVTAGTTPVRSTWTVPITPVSTNVPFYLAARIKHIAGAQDTMVIAVGTNNPSFFALNIPSDVAIEGLVKADGSVPMTGNLDLGGNTASNGSFAGNASGLTNLTGANVSGAVPVSLSTSNFTLSANANGGGYSITNLNYLLSTNYLQVGTGTVVKSDMGSIRIGASTSTNAGIWFGDDVVLYRSSAGYLYCPQEIDANTIGATTYWTPSGNYNFTSRLCGNNNYRFLWNTYYGNTNLMSLTNNAGIGQLEVGNVVVTNLLTVKNINLNGVGDITNGLRKGTLQFMITSGTVPNNWAQTQPLPYAITVTNITAWEGSLLGFVADLKTCQATNPLSFTGMYTGMVYTTSATAMTNQAISAVIPAQTILYCSVTNGAVTNAALIGLEYTY